MFLIEMIIALLFFCVSGAVILKVFAGADRKSHASARLERVVVLAQSIAEAYSVYGDAEKVAECVGLERLDTKIPDKNGEIILRTTEKQTETQAGELRTLQMRFFFNEEEIYTLDCSSYIHKNGGANIE
ncbi:MAG: hypothetical protein ACI4JS_07450 [Oscillospiraceae bacterium]